MTKPPLPWLPQELYELTGLWGQTSLWSAGLKDLEPTPENLEAATSALDLLLAALVRLPDPDVDDLPDDIRGYWSVTVGATMLGIPTWSDFCLDPFAQWLEPNLESSPDPDMVERYAQACARHAAERGIGDLVKWFGRVLPQAPEALKLGFLEVIRKYWRSAPPDLTGRLFSVARTKLYDQARTLIEEVLRDPEASPKLREELGWYLPSPHRK